MLNVRHVCYTVNVYSSYVDQNTAVYNLHHWHALSPNEECSREGLVAAIFNFCETEVRWPPCVGQWVCFEGFGWLHPGMEQRWAAQYRERSSRDDRRLGPLSPT